MTTADRSERDERDEGDGVYHDSVTVDVEPVVASPAGRFTRRRHRGSALITDARHTPEQNLRSRERRYMILQGMRIPFILMSMVAVYFQNWWLAGVLFIVSVPLPWIAVMIGNGQGEKRDPRQKNVYKPSAARAAARSYLLEEQRRRELDTSATDTQSVAIIDHDDE